MKSYRLNPIEKNIETVDITDAFLSSADQDEYLKINYIFNWLKMRGYKQPVLYGGALRDIVLELSPRDYDAEAVAGYDVLNSPDRQDRLSGIRSLWHKKAEITLDLALRSEDRQDETVQARALRADAPINSIAMDHNAKIYAHPKFFDHAAKRIYKIREDLNAGARHLAMQRYQKLSSKISGLTLGD